MSSIRSKNSESNAPEIAAKFFIIGAILVLFYFTKGILIPLIIAFLAAIVIYPFVRFLKNKARFPISLAIFTALISTLLLIAGLLTLFGAQIALFFNDWPAIESNMNVHFTTIQSWLKSSFGWSFTEQKNVLQDSLKELSSLGKSSLSSLESISGFVLNAVVIPIYIFFILIYRRLFIRFLYSFGNESDTISTHAILVKIEEVVRSYISGLLIQVVIVSFLTGLGYWIVGVKYFVFLGLLTGVLNLIPYLGILTAGILSMLMTFAGSTDLSLLASILIVNIIVQLLDNNVIVPKVVGSKVSINALASLLGVILGGLFAGIGGMFLAIPIIAILKVVFQHFPETERYAMLLGENEFEEKVEEKEEEVDAEDSVE